MHMRGSCGRRRLLPSGSALFRFQGLQRVALLMLVILKEGMISTDIKIARFHFFEVRSSN